MNHKTHSATSTPRFLVKHVGNMGDMIFIVPPVLAALKKEYPTCHITFITSWGYKYPRFKLGQLKPVPTWGNRNQGGQSLHLMITNPHIDQLVHWHDSKLSLDGSICREDGQSFPTWSKTYYQSAKSSGRYDRVIELDFGLTAEDNPVSKAFQAAGLSSDHDISYHLYLSSHDKEIANFVMSTMPHPRIVLLESLADSSTRGWDPGKIKQLGQAVQQKYQVKPIWFGSRYVPYYHGRPLTLRENIATLTHADAVIGVLSGPLHFAAAVGAPTLTLYCDHPIHRAAPAFFQNQSVKDNHYHRTLLGPQKKPYHLLKSTPQSLPLTPGEFNTQNFINWSKPGRQSTKSCLAVLTVDEIMQVLADMI